MTTSQQQLFDGFDAPVDNRAKLQQKFIVPPFSILDTRQGYWQERKKTWLSLGIKSEEGRDATCLPLGFDEEKYGIKQKEGTSIFDPLLCELIYKWFCPDGGTILDPFAGGSVRGIVASILGYDYTGIDLCNTQIEANRKQAQEIIPSKLPEWIAGDSYAIDRLLPQSKYYDLVFSCPPYHNLEQYTDDMDDLSNMSWGTFKQRYNDIIAKCILKLKPNRFLCFVVSEIRDEIGSFKSFVPFTIDCFNRNGARYYNEIILVNSVGTLPIRIANQFAYRKIGRTHQNILVFYKGDIEAIPKHFKCISSNIGSSVEDNGNDN